MIIPFGGQIKQRIRDKIIRKDNLSFFVGLLCIIGILSIFFFDAYIGIYDSLTYTDGEHTRDLIDNRHVRSIYTSHGKDLYFEYEITNNGFKDHETHVTVTMFIGGDETLTLHDSVITIGPFDSVSVNWKLESSRLEGNINYYMNIDTIEYQRSIRIRFSTPRTHMAELMIDNIKENR